MTNSGQNDFNDFSMLDIFRIEVENGARVLETGLVEVEEQQSPEKMEPLMRAAHSIKGAARIVGCANNTAMAYREAVIASHEDLDGVPPKCPCGQNSGHRGWCSHRYSNSPRRQEFMRNWHLQS